MDWLGLFKFISEYGLDVKLLFLILGIYIYFHNKEHDTLEKSRNAYKENISKKMEELQGNLKQISKSLSKYIFRFEAEDNAEYQKRMDKLIDLKHEFLNTAFFTVRNWVLENHDFTLTKEEYTEKLYQFCFGLVQKRYEEIGTIIDPLDLSKMIEVDRICLPYFKELVRLGVPSLLNRDLNGSKKFTVEAILTKILKDITEEWEKLFRQAYIISNH